MILASALRSSTRSIRLNTHSGCLKCGNIDCYLFGDLQANSFVNTQI
jgi:hypothetical protein